MATRKVLYVDSDPFSYQSLESQRTHIMRQQTICTSLTGYKITLVHDIHSSEVEEKLKTKQFDAFLPHLPYDRETFLYEPALNRLELLLKKYPIQTIVYPGAEEYSLSNEKILCISSQIKCIIRKTPDAFKEDAKAIKSALDDIFKV